MKPESMHHGLRNACTTRPAYAVCGFSLISMYDMFLDYCNIKKINVDSLLRDGLHPNDAGYEVMFEKCIT